MKKMILMAAVAVMAAVSANAQNFNKGDWFVGAQSTSLGFMHGFKKDYSGTNFNLSALGGYFLSDKFAVDATAGFTHTAVKIGDKNSAGYLNSNSSNFVFGAGVRYYPIGNLFARVGYNGNGGSGSDVTSYIDAKVGYDFFLNDKVYFEPAAYYEKNLNTGGGENILGLSLGLGVRF